MQCGKKKQEQQIHQTIKKFQQSFNNNKFEISIGLLLLLFYLVLLSLDNWWWEYHLRIPSDVTKIPVCSLTPSQWALDVYSPFQFRKEIQVTGEISLCPLISSLSTLLRIKNQFHFGTADDPMLRGSCTGEPLPSGVFLMRTLQKPGRTARLGSMSREWHPVADGSHFCCARHSISENVGADA